MEKELKAFTIMELLVAMVILCVVMGISFTLYQTTFKNYINLKRTNQQTGAAISLSKLMADDFFYSASIMATDNKIYFNTAAKPIVAYNLTDSIIVRTQSSVTDTFKLDPVSYSTLFAGKATVSGLIDELILTLSLTGERDTLYFHKNYGADILIKADSVNLLKTL